MNRYRITLGLSVCVFMTAAAGCSGGDEHPVGTVRGTVTYKDQPVPEGMLYVYNKETAHAGEGEIKEGEFELRTDLRTGTYTVFVTAIPPPPPNPENPPVSLWGKFPTDIPEKYQRGDQSNLTIDVKEGHNEVKIEIPSQ